MSHDILTNKLKYSLDKRDHFYRILVHSYLQVSELNARYVTKTLFKIVFENDIDGPTLIHHNGL